MYNNIICFPWHIYYNPHIGISIGFAANPSDFNITEGSSVSLKGQTTGFSYGDVPIQVTPLACSDYEGDLEELFTNIPADSADPGKHT